ncbi:hypothetical protein JZ751_023088 [Albula glossodonta]|uniref:Diablo homolog, mitochondrial n=1 Tax=Albula glossodonta TaxID=121402 RepID=A0A8T2PNC4_9TELE|nr:hypothetical protein JZ751_023088 [Albula glossodonta]
MQVLRQFTSGISYGRTDFLLLHSNMAAFRRGVYSVGLFRYTAGMLSSSSNSTRQRLLRLPTLIQKNWISLCTGGGLCAVPFAQKQREGLSHEALIRRASSLVTDSANTFLSQTTLAFVEALTQYVKAVHTLVALQKRYVASVTKLNPMEEEAVWQVIIRQRAEHSLANVPLGCDLLFSREKSFSPPNSKCTKRHWFWLWADQASITARTNLQVAQAHVEEVRQLSLEADRMLVETKAEEIERTKQLASMTTEEEDIPEAYLRED